MRTTLTLDDDVAAKLRARARWTGQAFRDVVNDALRRGLERASAPGPRTRFAVQARDLGRLAVGLSLDNVSALLERVEGPVHR